jgi:hypothetical protein
MDRIKELSKPSFKFTLFLILLGTVSFIGLFLPLLTQLNAQGQFLEGVGLFISGLGVLAPLGLGIYQIQQTNLQQSEDKGDKVTIADFIWVKCGVITPPLSSYRVHTN